MSVSPVSETDVTFPTVKDLDRGFELATCTVESISVVIEPAVLQCITTVSLPAPVISTDRSVPVEKSNT